MHTLLSADAQQEIARINLSLMEESHTTHVIYRVKMSEDVDCVERDEDDDINKAPPRRFVIRLERRDMRHGNVGNVMQLMIEDKIKLSAGVLTCDLVTLGLEQALSCSRLKEKFVALLIHLRVYCAACAGFQLVLDATAQIEMEPIKKYMKFSCAGDKYMSFFEVAILLNASSSKCASRYTDFVTNESLNPLQNDKKHDLVDFARSMINLELERHQRQGAVPLSSNMYIVAL